MAQGWEDSKIQALGEKYKELAAAGAPADVLHGIHQQAEKLRNELGYTGGHDGSQSGSYSGSSSKKESNKGNITVIGSVDDFDSPSYDFKPESVYSGSESGGSLDGGAIAGYVITGLVLIVVLDKLIG